MNKLIAGIMVVLALMFGGCSSGSNPPSTPPSTPISGITLTNLYWDAEGEYTTSYGDAVVVLGFSVFSASEDAWISRIVQATITTGRYVRLDLRLVCEGEGSRKVIWEDTGFGSDRPNGETYTVLLDFAAEQMIPMESLVRYKLEATVTSCPVGDPQRVSWFRGNLLANAVTVTGMSTNAGPKDPLDDGGAYYNVTPQP